MKFKYIVFLTIGLALASFQAFAQVDELKAKCLIFNQMKSASTALNIKYSIISTVSVGEDNLPFEITYSTDGLGNRKYLMGNAQHIIESPGKNLQIILPAQTIVYKIDSTLSQSISLEALSNQISSLIDSSLTITKSTDNIGTHYLLTYKPNYFYSTVKFSFNSLNNTPIEVTSTSNINVNNPMANMSIKFLSWTSNWIPNTGFPNFNDYISLENGKYVVTPSYSNYKLVVYENGKYKN